MKPGKPHQIAVLAAAIVAMFLVREGYAQEGEYERAGRSLADLIEVDDGVSQFVPALAPTNVDEARAAAEGIRKIAGRRLILFTDAPYDPEIEELPDVFEQAFPLWCEYFSIDPDAWPTWRMTGFLMKHRDRFRRAGLIPSYLPPFKHGFSVNYDLWMVEQPTTYYRRHLLLHEGTHGFMNTVLRSCGPPWYMEGTAELLGTHRWRGGRLELGVVPESRDAVPGWGRVRTIQDRYEEGTALSLEDILDFHWGAHRHNDAYAWSWAAAAFLDLHPRYRERFRALAKIVEARDFTGQFRKAVGDEWPQLTEEFDLFVGNLEYGYDVAPTAIDFSKGEPLEPGWNLVRIEAARGWQNTGLQLTSGAFYEIRARGRYQIAKGPNRSRSAMGVPVEDTDRPEATDPTRSSRIWWCEPGGVTIRYYRGRPLGILLAAVRPTQSAEEVSPLLNPAAIGLGATLEPESSGTLYLQVNDSAAELDDNAGTIDVAIRVIDTDEPTGYQDDAR